jgi:hypothetical protein
MMRIYIEIIMKRMKGIMMIMIINCASIVSIHFLSELFQILCHNIIPLYIDWGLAFSLIF